MRETKICPTCKKPFESRHGLQIFCSKECKPRNQQNPRLKVTRVCIICGKTFMGYLTSRYCGASCYKISCEQVKRENRLATKKSRQKAVCLWCRSEFYQEFPQHLICSGECYAQYAKMREKIMKQFSGEKRFAELAKLREQGRDYVLPQRVI